MFGVHRRSLSIDQTISCFVLANLPVLVPEISLTVKSIKEGKRIEDFYHCIIIYIFICSLFCLKALTGREEDPDPVKTNEILLQAESPCCYLQERFA